jgi:hypothetical protein
MRGIIVGYAVVLVWFVVGCNSDSHPPRDVNQMTSARQSEKAGANSSGAPKSDLKVAKDLKVQVPLGDGSPEDWGRVPFTITKVYQEQELTKTTPFHATGGKWTFFDCQAADSKPVRFTVGVCPRGDGKGPVAWGKAALVVADRAAGERFIGAFAKAFHASPPRARASVLPLEPLVMGTAILGENLKRSPGGGFDGTGEGWSATKWFPQEYGLEAEVFFNYNLPSREGEFSEKDPDYRQDLIAILATALRDGPRPDRTPDTDPNLTLVGPHIAEVCCLLPKRASDCSFTSDGKHIVYQDESVVYAVDPSQPEKPRELARFEKMIWSLHVVDNDMRLLVCEALPTSATGMSSDDPQRVWWVEPGAKDKQLLLGPEKDISVVDPPVSPDGRFVAIQRWKERNGQRGRYTTVTFMDRMGASSKVAELPNESLSASGWQGSGKQLRAVLIANRWKIDKNKPEVVYLADPTTGKIAQASGVPIPDSETRPVSPDGRRRAEVEGKERLVVVDLVTREKRIFQFHEDDYPFIGEGCVKWAGPRYLQLNAGRLALIDIQSMKMNYPVPRVAAGTSASYTFSPDFRWVLCQKEEGEKAGLYLGRILASSESRTP